METKFVLATFLALLFLVQLASASTITRSFSKSTVLPGETASVTLDVAVTGGETHYLIDDAVPQGWSIVNPEPGTQAGHFKVAVIQGAVSTSYTYEVTAPQSEGTYAFSGTYMFEGMSAEGPIGGQSTITVGAAAASKFGYEAAVVPAVIAAGAIISLALYKAKYRKK
jgi:hypothetical protein